MSSCGAGWAHRRVRVLPLERLESSAAEAEALRSPPERLVPLERFEIAEADRDEKIEETIDLCERISQRFSSSTSHVQDLAEMFFGN